MTWYHPALAQRALDECDAEIRKLRAEIVRLRAALAQIAVVCTDNMDRTCNHRVDPI